LDAIAIRWGGSRPLRLLDSPRDDFGFRKKPRRLVYVSRVKHHQSCQPMLTIYPQASRRRQFIIVSMGGVSAGMNEKMSLLYPVELVRAQAAE
jgi:hypothetical protein